MSAPLRFLGFAILSYVGLRTVSNALALQPLAPMPVAPVMPVTAQPTLPPGVPADMGPAPSYGYPYPYAYAGAPAMMPYPVMPAMAPMPRMQSFAYPVPYPMPMPAREARPEPIRAAAVADFDGGADIVGYGSPSAPLDQWPAIGTAGPFSVIGMQRTPRWGKEGAEAAPIDLTQPNRWSVDTWALMRPPRRSALSLTDPGRGLNPGLASAGSLGGSQAGMRVTWRPLSSLGVHLRASTALLPQGRGGQTLAGGEGAVGVSWQPLRQIPVRLLAERRQRLGSALGGGRNAFALLAEAASTTGSCRGASGSTAMGRPEWSGSAAATCSRTGR